MKIIIIEPQVKDFLIWHDGEELYELFKKNAIAYWTGRISVTKTITDIDNGFYWGDTDQGHDFWSIIEDCFKKRDENIIPKTKIDLDVADDIDENLVIKQQFNF